jgi:hypothetical protein
MSLPKYIMVSVENVVRVDFALSVVVVVADAVLVLFPDRLFVADIGLFIDDADD